MCHYLGKTEGNYELQTVLCSSVKAVTVQKQTTAQTALTGL